MKITFTPGAWNPDDFTQVTSLRTDGRTPFLQEEDGIVNDLVQKEVLKDHNYTSLLYHETYTAPTVIRTVCSFARFGAPLLVLTDDLIQTDDGYPAYGHHFEIVAYEKGINVWDLNGADKPIKAAFEQFPVPAGEKLTLTVTVLPGHLKVSMYGHEMDFPVAGLPSTFRCGFTGCEGINRFYSFSVNEPEI